VTSGLYVCGAGEGDRLLIGAVETRVVGPSSATGGAYCTLDQVIPAGLVSPAHRHEHEDQVAYVLEGRLGFWVEGSAETDVSAGALVARPRGLLHAVWNPSREPARILEITSPGESFERYMRRLSELTLRGEADESQVRALASAHGIVFAVAGDPSPRLPETQHDAFWAR
jgi:quercetin dioxygenase-like cupin family protein